MAHSQGLPDDVEALITACIESVEQIEILLLLRGGPHRPWSVDELSRQLRSSPHSVSLRVRPLVEHGLATMTGKLVRYAASPRDDGAVAALAGIYRLRRTAIIDRIFADRPDPMQSFADAFCWLDEPDDR